MTHNLNSIPHEWIKNYVDQLIRVAEELPENGDLQKSVIRRADAILDMVAVFRDYDREHGPSVT